MFFNHIPKEVIRTKWFNVSKGKNMLIEQGKMLRLEYAETISCKGMKLQSNRLVFLLGPEHISHLKFGHHP